VAAIVVNAILLVIVNNLTAWNWFEFITDDFGKMLWLIDISFAATIAVNVVFLVYDVAWFKAICQLGLSAISLAVAVRMYQVFPFDFSAYEGFDWARLAKIVIIVSIVAICIAIVAQLATALGRLTRLGRTPRPSDFPMEHDDTPPHPAIR
jgi:hypothetical protein